MLLDRLAGRAALGQLLEAARAGRSAVLVVHGEAGVGKTALLEDAVASAGRPGATRWRCWNCRRASHKRISLVSLTLCSRQDCWGGLRKASGSGCGGLAEATQRLLLVAAAEPGGDPVLLWRAAGRLGIGMAAAAAAQTDGLLT